MTKPGPPGGAQKLLDAQRNALLIWIAEGCSTREIKNRMANFDPPFTLGAATLYNYINRHNPQIRELQKRRDEQAINTGLAVKANRLQALFDLAKMLEDDLKLHGKLWLLRVKGIGSGNFFERIVEEEFNSAEVSQLRGVYDDIAKEVGARILDSSIKIPTSKTIRVTIHAGENGEGK
jgi:hypothetical protein